MLFSLTEGRDSERESVATGLSGESGTMGGDSALSDRRNLTSKGAALKGSRGEVGMLAGRICA